MEKEFDQNIISDPRIFEQNRLKAHSSHITYASFGELVSEDTSLRMSLDGVWKFNYSVNPSSIPAVVTGYTVGLITCPVRILFNSA